MMNEMAAQFDNSLLRAFVKFLGRKEYRMELRAGWDALAAHMVAPHVPAEHA